MVPGLRVSSKPQIPLRKSLKLVRWMTTRELIPFGLGSVHRAHISTELTLRIPTMVSAISLTMTRTSSTMTRLAGPGPVPIHPEETLTSLERLLKSQMRLARNRFATACRIPMPPVSLRLSPNSPSQPPLRSNALAMRSTRNLDISRICKQSPAFGEFRKRSLNPPPLVAG
jgi:hypothetical protein